MMEGTNKVNYGSKKIPAYAKINLYLDIEEKLQNGYHKIKSIMQTIDLCDFITITVSSSSGASQSISLSCDNYLINSDIPTDKNNLAWKAANEFLIYTGIQADIDLHIEKHIPSPGGLGGGSADCAATLKALNEICGTNLTVEQLFNIGLKIGSDVPFCLVGGICMVEGVGEVVVPIENESYPSFYYLVANKGEGISTRYAFGLLDKKYDDFIYFTKMQSRSLKKYNTAVSAHKSNDHMRIYQSVYNIFENVILNTHSWAKQIKNIMRDNNAGAAVLSGSGPSVVGLFSNYENAASASAALKQFGVTSSICRAVNNII